MIFAAGVVIGFAIAVLTLVTYIYYASEPVVENPSLGSPWDGCSKREHFGLPLYCPHCVEEHLRGVAKRALHELEQRRELEA